MLRALLVGTALFASVDAAAVVTPLTRIDMEHAVALARWPRSDGDRARFHRPYLYEVTGAAVESFAITQVEVVTEFRRLELIAEAHARANDTFGRGSLRDAEEAIRPWRGRVSIVIHLDLVPSNRYVTGVPRLDVVLGGPDPLAAIDTQVAALYGFGEAPALKGGTVESAFDAASIGRARRPVLVRYAGRELARAIVDFAALQ